MAGADEQGQGALGSNYRIVFAAIWLAIQAILIVTAERRVNGPFDFRSERKATSALSPGGR